MKKAILAALLLASPALAQPHGASDPAAGGGNMREPNLANPQAQTNQGMQPPNAHQVDQGQGLGQAPAIPTPTLNRPMTPVR